MISRWHVAVLRDDILEDGLVEARGALRLVLGRVGVCTALVGGDTGGQDGRLSLAR